MPEKNAVGQQIVKESNAAYGFQTKGAQLELTAHMPSGRRDSNPRPPEPIVLPTLARIRAISLEKATRNFRPIPLKPLDKHGYYGLQLETQGADVPAPPETRP